MDIDVFWYMLPLFLIITAVAIFCGYQVYHLIKADLYGPDSIYTADEVLEQIDEENVMLTITDKQAKDSGLKTGDLVSIEPSKGKIIIRKL